VTARRSIAAVLGLLSAGGCSRCDGGGSRGAEVHVVARSLSDKATLAMLEDGSVVLDTGVSVYRVPDDGPIALVGDRSSYAAFLPADDGTPVVRGRARSFFGTKDAPMMIEGSDAFAFADRAWNKTKARAGAPLSATERTRGPRRDASTAVPPADVRAQAQVVRKTYRRYPDGTFVGLGREFVSPGSPPTPIGFVIRPGSKEEVIVPVPDANGSWTCEQAPSADGKAYVDCHAHDGTLEERRLYVLDERTWARVPIPRQDLEAPLAIGKDGAVWMALSEPAGLVVRSPGGRITGVALPKIPESLARASYRGTISHSNLPRPQQHDVDNVDRVVDLVPASGGSMFVLARELGIDGALVLLRVGGQAVAHPQVVGTEIDQLVDIRNADEPKRWIGHCRAVFVALRRDRDAGSLSLLPSTDGTWVEGRLRDKTVAGVVFANGSYDETSFENAVTAFLERNTTNPTSPPEVTCTLPVLDRVK
jgi:hypothetical protein